MEPPTRDELSVTRTALPLDRTLLSCIRTSLTLMGFGFTLAKFVHELVGGQRTHMDPAYPHKVGFALMGMGVLTLVGGVIQHVLVGKQLAPARPPWSIMLGIAIGLIVVCLFLMVNLAHELNIF